MDVWRFWGGVCIIFWVGDCTATTRHSDPFEFDDENRTPQFDAVDHVPGESLSPMDYQNAESLMNIVPPSDGKHSDPIELAGLFEGDIILAPKDARNISNSEDFKNAIINERQKWPGGVIPYLISAEFNNMERSVIAKAFMEYHAKTCIVFRPRTRETDFIHITKGQGCSSHVGRTGGGQPVSLGTGCIYPGICIHELMHAVGFWHEQSRWDRDDFVQVYFNNITPGMEFNFQKYSWKVIQNLSAPYDTRSVMHYGAYAFSKDRRYPTILPKNPNDKIGQRDTFSTIDLQKINKLYKCSEGQVKPTVKPTVAPDSKCTDSHKYCASWAQRGECKKNPSWMLINCKKACQQCNSPCTDSNHYCGIWKNRGECQRNPDYMKVYCAKSCATCVAHSGSESEEVCRDKDNLCSAWANRGECTTNPKFMTKNCPKSCRKCPKKEFLI